MKIRIHFTAQIRDIAGKPFEELQISSGSSLQDTVQILTETHPNLKDILFDKDKKFRQSNLLIINGQQVFYNDNPTVLEKDEITLMSPISGG